MVQTSAHSHEDSQFPTPSAAGSAVYGLATSWDVQTGEAFKISDQEALPDILTLK